MCLLWLGYGLSSPLPSGAMLDFSKASTEDRTGPQHYECRALPLSHRGIHSAARIQVLIVPYAFAIHDQMRSSLNTAKVRQRSIQRHPCRRPFML